MTKQVRIENADPSATTVVVEVWQKSHAVDGIAPAAHYTLVDTIRLDHPTALAAPTLTAERYLVVKEA